MKAKEDKIREAYGEYWEEMKPWINEDGWFDKNAFYNKNFYFKHDDLKLFFSHKEDLMRPKSLQGIENNNGWLPYIGNSIGYYDFVYTDAGNIYPYAVFVSYDSICCVQKITHYQPVQKPQPPLY